MSIPTTLDPLGSIVQFKVYANFNKRVDCPPIEGITSSDTTRLRTVVDFYCSSLTIGLQYDVVFSISYPNSTNYGRWFLYHDGLSGKNTKNEWIIENNTGIWETTAKRNYPIILDSDNTIDLNASRAILNGTVIPTGTTGPYTKNALPVCLQFQNTYCIKYKSAQIYIDDVLLQDWRAVMRNGKEGMYDVIGKTFVSG